jgi:hypothetical protein
MITDYQREWAECETIYRRLMSDPEVQRVITNEVARRWAESAAWNDSHCWNCDEPRDYTGEHCPHCGADTTPF